MSIEVQQTEAKSSASSGWSIRQFLLHHPLWGYFLLAYGLQWLWELPMFGIWHQWFPGPWLILSPTLAAFIMAWIVEGKAGMRNLFHRCLRWRAGVQWYLLTFLCIPALFLVGFVLMPGGLPAFRVPTLAFLSTYILAFVVNFFAAPFTEEPGWRGYALPLMQERHGPVVGTLILGLFWGLWHLPFWILIPGHSGAGSGLLGIGIPFVDWMAFIMGFTVLITWVSNQSRGSVLLAMLFHASINTTVGTFPGAFLPTLFPPTVAAHTGIPLLAELGMLILGIVLIMTTRGRLGYDRYRQDTALTTPKIVSRQ